MTTSSSTRFRYRELREERRRAWLDAGHLSRKFFSHRFHVFPKCGPDGFLLAKRMLNESEPERCWSINLYAGDPAIRELPQELFFDDDIMWHRQQFGLPGYVATASLLVRGDVAHLLVCFSDLVQRIPRRREWKTRVEKVFEGWPEMVLNAVAAFALEIGASSLHVPTADLSRRHTDPKRDPKPEMFERVYDRAVHRLYGVESHGEWWTVDLTSNSARIVQPDRAEIRRSLPDRTICITHDVERGLGHHDVDEQRVKLADATWERNVKEMLEIEAGAGVRATYNVVGTLWAELHERIRRAGHALGFHSYDHGAPLPCPLPERPDSSYDQLQKCRAVDYRTRGYRAPRSCITDELRASNLCFHNFEWFSSSERSLGHALPRVHERIVHVPVLFDDFPMYQQARSYREWEEWGLGRTRNKQFAAIGLHDCYGEYWIPHYAEFLKRIADLGELRTLDEVADDLILGSAV